MSDETLDCPCCGDVGAICPVSDGQSLCCGCPGWVSFDAESEPWINNGDDECIPCGLRARIAELEKEVERLREEVGCRTCREGKYPQVMIDKGGTLASLSGLPGYRGHVADDAHWYCDDRGNPPPELLEARIDRALELLGDVEDEFAAIGFASSGSAVIEPVRAALTGAVDQ